MVAVSNMTIDIARWRMRIAEVDAEIMKLEAIMDYYRALGLVFEDALTAEHNEETPV